MNAAWAVVREAVSVGVVVVAIAFGANAISPRGLRLSRDYFPRTKGGSPSGARANEERSAVTSVERRLQQRGLGVIGGDEVRAAFRDPQFGQGIIVFVDARDDEHYRAGHIPRAWPFNHYRLEEQLPRVLPACLSAMKVVVYCTGGDCEDSEFAAIALRDAGVPAENLFVYAGGIADWTAKKGLVEMGERGSGEIRPQP